MDKNNIKNLLYMTRPELRDEIYRLKAEVERLTKAGDAISLCLEAFWKGKPYDTSTNIKCFKAWNAAKEGK